MTDYFDVELSCVFHTSRIDLTIVNYVEFEQFSITVKLSVMIIYIPRNTGTDF